MATITFRLPDAAKADVEARASRAGMDVTAFIRHALDLERDGPDLTARLDELEADVARRLGRLEEVAGL